MNLKRLGFYRTPKLESRVGYTATMLKRDKAFYGWTMVAVTAVVLLVTAGARSAPTALLLPMQASEGWSKSQISFAVGLGLVLFGLGGPLAGNLMQRFGVRNVSIVSLLLTSLSMVLSSLVRTTWQLDLTFGLLSGLGTGLVSSVLGATVANRWFIAKRGLVTGIFGASTSAGQLIFVPLLVALAAGMGWRNASLVIAAIAVLVVLPVVFLMRDEPSDVKQRPLGATADTPTVQAQSEQGMMARALKSLDFWLLAGTFFICGATSNGLIGNHLIPHAVEHGLSQPAAANIYALMGLFNFVGTIGSGYLTDRYDPRRLLMTYYGFRGLSLLILPFVHDVAGLSVFAVMFGLDYIATVPPTVALVADVFGRRNVGVVYGWVFAAHQLGAALAGWLAAVARESFGDYGFAFLVAGSIAIAGSLLSLGIRRHPAPGIVQAATD
jgi:sugar phosphate permease